MSRIDIPVDLGPRAYVVSVCVNGGPAALAERVAALAPSGVVLVADGRVDALYGDEVREGLRAVDPQATTIRVPSGEQSKSLEGLAAVWRGLQSANLDRDGVVVAVGGGVMGDLGGFAAATWLRGVRVVHAPTTLLSMVDSAVGGKTGIDLHGKNVIGAFHQPSGVVADLRWLETLPPRELRSGLGEVWKTAILSGEPLFSRLERSARAVLEGDVDALLPIVAGCAAHKAAIVSQDEREQGPRASLNLGHTLGHALEAIALEAGQPIPHGEAVSIGVAFVCRLARRLGLLEPTTCDRLLAVGRSLGLSAWPAGAQDLEALRPWLARDKKARRGRARWVLPTGLGTWRLQEVDDAPLAATLAERADPRRD